MQRLRMKTLYVTADRTVQPDQVAEFDDDTAEALVEGGFALPEDDDPSHPDERKPRRPGKRPATRKTVAPAATGTSDEPPAGATAEPPAE